MITTPLLVEKDRVQRELAQAAGYDVDRYFALVHRLFEEMQVQYGFIPQYADLPGGPLFSAGDEPLPSYPGTSNLS
jgi:hypothetical protein